MVLRNPLRRVFFRLQKTETRSFVAAAEGCVWLRSSRRPYKRGETERPQRLICDCFAAERSLRQQLQGQAFRRWVVNGSHAFLA